MNTDVSKLFAYEEAEHMLDAFAADPKRLRAFARAYRKLKFMAAAYAFCDYMPRKASAEDKRRGMAYAWEDIQIAFTGRGEWALHGCLLQMWSYLRPREHKAFARLVEEAFTRAEELTHMDAPRRYLPEYRRKPPRLPEEDWDLPTLLPMSGAVLHDWALDSGNDPADVEHEWAWIEVAEREQQFTASPAAPDPSSRREKKRSHLHLVQP